jgi:hypothetical protein
MAISERHAARRSLLRYGLYSVIFNTAIAALLTAVGLGERFNPSVTDRFFVNLVYSQCIGLPAWFLIDAPRHLLWPDQRPSAQTFPQRNRVISGLADATIVVEAGLRSGALITAKWALEQGRGLFLVPGPIDEPRSAGCLHWLREYPGAAAIVATLPELLADLGLFDSARPTAPLADAAQGPTDTAADVPRRPPRPGLEAVLVELGTTARDVGAALVGGHGSLDELVAATGHEPATVLGAITLLELRGLATTTYGRYRAAGQLAAAASPEVRFGPPGRLPVRPGPC